MSCFSSEILKSANEDDYYDEETVRDLTDISSDEESGSEYKPPDHQSDLEDRFDELIGIESNSQSIPKK